MAQSPDRGRHLPSANNTSQAAARHYHTSLRRASDRNIHLDHQRFETLAPVSPSYVPFEPPNPSNRPVPLLRPRERTLPNLELDLQGFDAAQSSNYRTASVNIPNSTAVVGARQTNGESPIQGADEPATVGHPYRNQPSPTRVPAYPFMDQLEELIRTMRHGDAGRHSDASLRDVAEQCLLTATMELSANLSVYNNFYRNRITELVDLMATKDPSFQKWDYRELINS